ncbi:hypothetical protein GF406_23630 [candidate division KSB1 bacterium]|nr:hypothetical protein [candidate division KSB1 bacterium]
MGYTIFLLGLGFVLHLIGLGPVWIAAILLVFAGLGIMSGVRKTRK